MRDNRHRAGVLLILAWALTLHQWIPALLVIAFVTWAILHKRLEGDLGPQLARWWRRAWPPSTVALIVLLAASTAFVWGSEARIAAKLLPVALNILGLSMVLSGGWSMLSRRMVAVHQTVGEKTTNGPRSHHAEAA